MDYKGKVGKHMVWDSMPAKGMMSKGLDKKSLPSLKAKVWLELLFYLLK